jgi:hypothetical protein
MDIRKDAMLRHRPEAAAHLAADGAAAGVDMTLRQLGDFAPPARSWLLEESEERFTEHATTHRQEVRENALSGGMPDRTPGRNDPLATVNDRYGATMTVHAKNRTTILSTGALALLLLVAGCGDDDDQDNDGRTPAGDTAPPVPGGTKTAGSDADQDNTKLDDAALRTKVQTAAAQVKTVHTVGALRGKNGETRFDLHVDNSTRNYTGTLTEAGQTVQIMRVGADMYLKAGADYWTKAAKVTDPGALALVQDKNVKLKVDDPRFKSIGAVAELGDINKAVADWGPSVQRRPETDVAGSRAIVFADTDPQEGETLLYVPAKGEAHPIRMENKDPADGGIIDWNEHNKPVTVTPPAPDTIVNLPALTGETPATG